MINPFKEINWQPNIGELRKFGVTLAIGGTVVVVLMCLLRSTIDRFQNLTWVLAVIFSVVLVLGLLTVSMPKICRPIYYVWYFFGACIGFVVTNTIFIVFFYCFFSLIAVVMRFTDRDPLRLARRKTDTYWVPHRQPPSSARYYRQY
tara:strand:+ start:588 stop:1028 length:441 start_codon:yes stop_codon:yes gene_type:complete